MPLDPRIPHSEQNLALVVTKQSTTYCDMDKRQATPALLGIESTLIHVMTFGRIWALQALALT